MNKLTQKLDTFEALANNSFIGSPSPHIVTSRTTQKIMLDVLIALLPAIAISTVFFGPSILLLTAVCIIAGVLFEAISQKLMKRKVAIMDFSIVVTAVLFAMNLPPSFSHKYDNTFTAPYQGYIIAIIGMFFAVVIVKQMFGGLGNNFMNPALAARVFLLNSWANQMTSWSAPLSNKIDTSVDSTIDVVTTATPLAEINNGVMESFDLLDLFFGSIAGSFGEVSAIALLLGGLYLVIRKVITPLIPLVYMGSVFILTLLIQQSITISIAHLLSGGLILGAVFMATDYSTSPESNKGKVIFAIGCGLITVLLRLYSVLPEGVSYAIILMNCVTPLIDKYTRRTSFGR